MRRIHREPKWGSRCREGITDDAVARAIAGDQAAYGELVARYTALAHRTAYLLGAGADAGDVVQEAFVKAYRKLHTFKQGLDFKPWLLKIVANETKNLHRGRRRRNLVELRLATITETVDHDDPGTLVDDSRAKLLKAVRSLSEADRQVVTCRYLLDLSEAETAQILGLAKGTVKSRLSRALARLRPMLEEVAHDR
ncbi:RNA polymerase sigma factor [Lentzea sp. HUAS12]|uniref:RNA polymerase sigma factor n=1 Tax=Lentzea sp. HUAS12 TaxID=2951806 RepID=UPI00209D2AEA|nr:sigma-70 family RNA polymerase sigma factor [Lentzea sp. HUAS12]USX49407.1 sigma-70 family RNA polymerase sigma factor [Lentzea sp. HUAS12]